MIAVGCGAIHVARNARWKLGLVLFGLVRQELDNLCTRWLCNETTMYQLCSNSYRIRMLQYEQILLSNWKPSTSWTLLQPYFNPTSTLLLLQPIWRSREVQPDKNKRVNGKTNDSKFVRHDSRQILTSKNNYGIILRVSGRTRSSISHWTFASLARLGPSRYTRPNPFIWPWNWTFCALNVKNSSSPFVRSSASISRTLRSRNVVQTFEK